MSPLFHRPAFPACWTLLCLLSFLVGPASAFPPKIFKTLPNITVEAGQAFAFQVDPSSFQSNKQGGSLNYTLKDTANSDLPSWVTFSSSNITVQGTTIGGQDTIYVWTLTATDRDGERSSQNFTFSSLAPCPSGLFRHFRVRLSSNNQGSYYQPQYPGSYVCSVLWSNSNETTLDYSYPSASLPAFNISGTAYTGRNQYSDPAAIPQEGFQDVEDDLGQHCNFFSSWKVRTTSRTARDYVGLHQIHQAWASTALQRALEGTVK